MGNSYMEVAIALLIVTGIKVLSANNETTKDNTMSCLTVDESTRDNIDIIKSENDKRDYKYITLNNKLRLLLVSDPGIEKSAAAVSINAGYSSDPPMLPGLAHFCEHMLFLGTSKYSDEAEFSNFLGQHSGRSNAYTSTEYTTYHFDVKSDALEPALDRFAQFFLSPLFDANSTDRELHAIDQEYQKNYLEDSRRIHYIEKSSSRPGHKYANFGGGNLETLKKIPQEKNIDIRQMLLQFYNNYYSANIMTVSVLGKENLDDLQKMAVPLFDSVKNRNTVLPRHVFPYSKNELGVMLKIPTVREMNRMEVKFQLPDFRCFYRSKPSQYLSQVIGHEGKGSLLSLLKKKGWAHALWAGDRAGLRGFDFFIIGIDLTKDGFQHVDDIITLIFQYVEMLKRSPPKRRIYDEMKALDKIQFRFQDKQDSRQYAQTLAENMHIFSPQHVLNGKFLNGEFMPERITELLSYFSPKKFRYFVASRTFDGPTNKRVKYYDTDYTSEKIPSAKIHKWNHVDLNINLHLPRENPFIPDLEDLAIVVPRKTSTVKGVPVIIKDNEISRVWHKADDTFYLPKSTVKIEISSPHASVTPSHLNHLSVFVRLIQDAMMEFGYAAQLAGIRYHIRWVYTGILINIDGLSSRQDVLLRKILDHVTFMKKRVKREKFNVAKQKLLEYLKNVDVQVPYRQTEQLRSFIVSEMSWNARERLQYMEELSVYSLTRYVNDFLRNIYIEGLFCGNILRSNVLNVFNDVEKILITNNYAKAMLPLQHMRRKEYNIPHGSNYLYERKSKIHAFSALQIYLQVGLQSERNNVLCELFLNMIYAKMFDTLRTKEQLGYVVFSGLSRSQSVQGIRIQVQSDKEPAYVDDRIDKFFETFGNETLLEMSETKFNDYVEATRVRKLETPKQIWSEASIYTLEINRRQYHFRRAEKEAALLRELNKTDVINFFKKYVDPASEHRKKLAVVVLGTNATTLSESKTKHWTTIKDVLAFKTSLPLYPHIMPYNNVTLLSDKKSKLNNENPGAFNINSHLGRCKSKNCAQGQR